MNTVFFFAALVAFAINVEQIHSLPEDVMASYNKTIYVKDPSWSSFSSGIIKSQWGFYYTSDNIKYLTLSTTNGCGLLAAIRLLDLRPNAQDYLKLESTNRSWPTAIYNNSRPYRNKMYDDKEISNTYYVPNGQMIITFSTGPHPDTLGYTGFELIYTSQANSSSCRFNNFRCNNGRCISNEYGCDGHNHCGDRSDQQKCSSFIYPQSPHGGRIAGIVGGVIFLLIAAACAIFIAVRRATRSKIESRTVINHPPPNNVSGIPPPYQEPGTYYPPPPPPYSQYNQGITNPGFR